MDHSNVGFLIIGETVTYIGTSVLFFQFSVHSKTSKMNFTRNLNSKRESDISSKYVVLLWIVI